MVAPLIIGAGIGAGATLLGGLLGRDSAEKQQFRSERLQKEFAQHGIQWRVEDARAAGVHPVYALGGSGASSAGIPVMTDPLGEAISSAGQQFSRAVGAGETDVQRAQRHVALQLANASYAKDMAMASYYDSLAARQRQEANQSAAIPDPVVSVDPVVSPVTGGPAVLGTGIGSAANRIKVNPAETTSYAGSDPSVAAASDVMWRKYRVGGREWLLPNASSAGEALESVSESWPLTYVVIAENMRRNPNFVRENADLIPFGRTGVELMDALSVLGSSVRRAPEDYRWGDLRDNPRGRFYYYRR